MFLLALPVQVVVLGAFLLVLNVGVLVEVVEDFIPIGWDYLVFYCMLVDPFRCF